LDEYDLALGDNILSAAWNPNDILAIGTTSNISIYDATNDNLVAQFDSRESISLSWNSVGNRIALLNDGAIEILAPDTGTILASFPNATSTYFVDWNPNGSDRKSTRLNSS